MDSSRMVTAARRLLWCAPALAATLSAAAIETPAKVHPRLVSAQSTRCVNCHEALVKGKASVHAPAADDCKSCHAVAVAATGTTITLTETQPALCVTCHSDLEAAAKGTLKAPHAPVTDTCTSCHDPHGSAAPRLLKSRPADLCASCHDQAGLQKSHGGLLTASVDCTHCHLPHGSANARMLTGSVRHAPFADKGCDACHRPPLGGRVRLQARAEALCSSCHGDIPLAAKAGGSWHQALKGTRGVSKSGCLSCHDPHMSQNKKLLVKAGTSLCANCHGEVVKAAGAKGGHAPAKEDCLSCHAAHASDKPFLLADAPRAVCLGCHDGADARLRKAHLQAKLETLECTSCHTPHGAGNAKALARYLHAPVADGCDACHQGSASKLTEDGNSPLCLACHDTVGQQAKAAKVPHAAMEAARCVDCHNPHASPRQRLVKLPGGGSCLACHSDQAAGPGESAHGAIAVIGCQSCHEPHGGARPKLLRAEGNDLCLSCHRAPAKPFPAEGMVKIAERFEVTAAAARAIRTLVLSGDGRRGHPTPGHLVLGTPDPKAKRDPGTLAFKGELSCLTCHDPHKGKSPQILRGGAASGAEACLACHKK